MINVEEMEQRQAQFVVKFAELAGKNFDEFVALVVLNPGITLVISDTMQAAYEEMQAQAATLPGEPTGVDMLVLGFVETTLKFLTELQQQATRNPQDDGLSSNLVH